MLTASCLCGRVEFSFKGKPIDFNVCHCKMCQKFHGSDSGPYVWFRKSDFEIIKGSEYEKSYCSSDIADRSFCMECGSSLRYIYKKDPEIIFVSAGILNQDPLMQPSHHIFVKDKCSWSIIPGDVPQAQTWLKK